MKRQLLITSALILSTMTCKLDVIAQQFTAGGIEYKVTGQAEVQATGYDNATPNIVIPATISYESKTYSVKQVNVSFQGSKALRTITIAPQTGFFNGSFEGCENLETVSIPLEEIGEMQFYDCPALDITSLIESESNTITAIGSMAFGLSNPRIFENIDLRPFENIASGSKVFHNRQYRDIIAGTSFHELDVSKTENLTLLFNYPGAGRDEIPMECLKKITLNGYDPDPWNLSNGISSVNYPNLESVIIGDKVTTFSFSGENGSSPNIDLMAATSLHTLSIQSHETMTELNIPKTVTTLYVSQMPSLLTITGTDGVTTTMVNSCPKIKQLSFPSLEELHDYEIVENNDLREIYIGKSIKSIASGAIVACKKLEDLVYEGTLEEWNAISFEPSGILSKFNNFWYGHGSAKLTNLTELISLGNAHQVNTGAFTGYKGLTKVSLPVSVKTINYHAFEGCTALKNVSLKADSIRSYSFQGCTALETFDIDDNLKYIGWAFERFAASGQTVTVHYGGEFAQWKNVERIPDFNGISQSSGLMRLANGGFYFNGKLIDIIDYDDPERIGTELAGSSSVKHIVIHCNSRYPYIDNGAFANTYNLSRISLGAVPMARATGGFIVGDEAFYNCYNLTDIEILGNLERVDADAFYDTGWYRNQAGGPVYLNTLTQGKCAYTFSGVAPEGTVVEFEAGTETILPSTTSHSEHEGICGIILPEGLRTIGQGAFSSNIKGNLTLPSSVETVGSQFATFDLDQFRIEDSKSPLSSFLNGVRAKEIYIGRDITPTEMAGIFYIPAEEGTVTDFTYGPNVTRVGKQTSLTSGEPANLNNMHCLAIVPPTCDSEEYYNWETYQDETVYYAFQGIDMEECTLYVPEGSIEAYKAAPGWSLFRNIVGIEISGIDAINIADDLGNNDEIHYDYLGRPICPNASGLHIIHKGNDPVRKVIKR